MRIAFLLDVLAARSCGRSGGLSSRTPGSSLPFLHGCLGRLSFHTLPPHPVCSSQIGTRKQNKRWEGCDLLGELTKGRFYSRYYCCVTQDPNLVS